MTWLAVAAAPLAALWLFSRVGVFLIERNWPPVGTLIEVDGLRVHVLDVPAAAPAGPTLLLIHGASGNLRELILPLRDALGGRFRLVAIDRPGNGHTTRGGREMSDPCRQADLVAAVLSRIGVGSCLVLGHSWGAAVAAALAERHLDRVEGLVLVAPASHPWPGGISRRSRFFATPYIGHLFAELFVVPLGLKLMPPMIRFIFSPDPVPPDYARRIGAALAIRPKSFVANCRDLVDFRENLVRLCARYSAIRAPTEIVAAERDRIVSPTIHAGRLARDIPGARLTLLEGAGHMPHWIHPQEIVAAIDRVASAANARKSAA